MSEIEVSHISDEDVLRRMWQQTEDFSRKKEIRAHMYRLREERLRNLYSPEPATDGKGCEFSSAQGHSQSFADQTFQSMKSKEVRDAGSPPKEFAYRGQDLKEHSNAGWNVESEDRITDDGRTHVKSVNANIEGRYDVDGGRGQFTAVDRQRQAVTEHHDDRSSLRRDERSTTTAAHDHVVRQTDDGARISSTTNSSNTSSSFQQVSSTKHETVPYVTDDDYNQARRTAPDVSRNERITRITNSDDFEHTSRRNDDAGSDLVSRKVDYPDDNTKVIVETRSLPDGTRVTSTRREFRAPAQTTRSEYQTKSETQSYSSQHRSDVRDVRDSTSNFTRQTIDDRTNDIVDSQRIVDDSDFKRQLRESTIRDDENNEDLHRRHVTKIDRKVTDYTQTDDDYSQKVHERRRNNRTVESTDDRDHTETRRRATGRRSDNRVDEVDRHQTKTSHDRDVHQKIVKESRHVNDTKERINMTRERNDTEEKTYHISRDQTNVSEKIDTSNENRTPINRIDEPRDKTIPVVTHVPEDIPADRLRDVSMGETPSFTKFRDIPKDTKIPVDKLNDNPSDRIKDINKDRSTTDERVHHITKNTNVEEIVENKTSSDHYQTTYQNDFQTRKISTDWSPTHQAWASTLRSDTTSTTRPSTRASSPGSKTFKSSTSSLRSSVSPDKTPRKPSNREVSPNKVDRTSPTRSVTSDRYSSTRSTYSITELNSNKNSSPERKPPTGHSPTRPGYSPDRKPHDVPRQRPSVSPEKRPQSFTNKPSSNPDRKSPVKPNSKDKHHRTPSPSMGHKKSPEKKPSLDGYPSDTYPQTSPYRSTTSPNRTSTEDYLKRPSPRSSPDRKPSSQNDYSPSRRHPLNDLSKTVTSPDVKPGYQQPQQPGQPLNENHDQSSTKRPSVSPDRKPGYMRPTAASRPNDDKQKKLVNPVNELDSKSPTKQDSFVDSTSEHFIRTSKIKEDHYTFVDEETKVYTHSDKTNIDDSLKKMTTPYPRDGSTSHIPSEDSPDFCKMPDKRGESPSPQRNTDVITKNDHMYSKIDKTNEKVDTTKHQNQRCEEITTTNIERKSKNKVSPTRNEPSRDTSPSKYDTYEKKKTHDNRTTTEETKDSFITQKHKIIPKNVDKVPSSPTKRSPRDSTSPVKSPTKDLRVIHTTDFLNTERKTEQINKKVTSGRPRELITPSSSPTRKQKTTDTEPSTGQSSPTTSVSGFVYFGSPRSETDLVTDLDENYPEAENKEEIFKRPETLDVKRSPSPSKIPCRSPSPEKHVPTIKDNLPRKSSLKKPSTNVDQASPVEKPPTSFRVSPTGDKPVETGHKTIKKDHPREPETGESEPNESDFTTKPKPPLQRRETYEDRCKKILGMVEDTTAQTVAKNSSRLTKKTDSSQSSPSVSPCDSPAPKESSPLSDYLDVKKTTTKKIDVSDFIKHEKEDLSKTTKADNNINKIVTSREHSPSKLQQDFNTKSTQNISTINKTENTKYSSSTQKPEKPDFQNSEEIEYSDFHKKVHVDSFNEKNNKRPSKSPERKPSRSNLKLDSKPENKYLDRTTPSKASPEKTLTFSKTTTSNIDELKQTTHITTVDEIQQEIREATTNVRDKTHPTRVLESPTRQIPDAPGSVSSEHPQNTVPLRPQTKDKSPSNNIKTPQCKSERLYDIEIENQEYDNNTQMRRSKSPEKLPHNIKTTKTKSQCDTIYGTDYVDKSYTKETRERKEPQSKSPTRQLAQNQPGSPNKPGHFTPSRADSLPSESLPKEMLSKTPRNEEQKNATKPHIPGYMKTTTAVTSKFDVTVSDVSHEKTTNIRKTSKTSPEIRTPSPTKPSRQFGTSPERKSSSSIQPSPPTKDTPKNQQTKYPKSSSPTKIAPDVTPGYMKTTATVTSKYDTAEYTKEDVQEKITSTTTSDYPDLRKSLTPSRQIRRSTIESAQENLRSTSPPRSSHPTSRKDDFSPQRKLSTPDDNPTGKFRNPSPNTVSHAVPTKTPGYIKTTTDVTSTTQFETTSTAEVIEEEDVYTKNVNTKHSSKAQNNRTITDCNRASEFNDLKDSQDILESIKRQKSSSSKTPHSPERQSPIRKAPECEPKVNIDYLSKPEDSRQLRTPSPAKKTVRTTEESTDFIISEREQEILNKVQNSLRKLSPERKVKSPSREKSPAKTTTSLHDLDISSKETIQSEYEESETIEKYAILSKDVQRRQTKEEITTASRLQSKPSSRNVSPLKKTPSTTNKFDKTPESPTKSRSISPKKPVSHVDRPQSPQVPKTSGIKPREQIPYHLTRKPTPATLSTTKFERLTTDVKKINGTTKQNVFNKTTMSKTATRTIPSPTTKNSESDFKRTPISKSTKDNVSPKKDSVSRTTSDITMKSKKPSSPQRMKSKPEIQVSDMSTKTPKSQKPTIKEPYSKLPTKPKSATALNTSTDDDDVIIDVQQSKSSRENSPDRICPTPINFCDDVGTPRFPDEVSEPDDEIIKRTYHTIHETESLVDDIVEICEDEELFSKKSDLNVITERDDSLLSVNDKVGKFTSKIQSVVKPKDTTMLFKDKEKRVHSDFIEENLKSDECLLTVSEKVNKFAKGPKDTKKSRSPSRNITEEYDNNTVYTDDYTKLSVNDKAHLFVGTAENIQVAKLKPAQKVERPDLSHVDESLKSDDCLLSVSDKVNKFVKTAEQYMTETQLIEETDSRIKEQHEIILKQITDETNEEDTDDSKVRISSEQLQRGNEKLQDHRVQKEPKTRLSKQQTKPTERVPTVKITTLRSSEAVKKAKALFENIASTQKTTQKDATYSTKNTKLTDIGVIKKSSETDSTTVLHPSVEDVSPQVTDSEGEIDAPSNVSHHTDGFTTKPRLIIKDEKPRGISSNIVAATPQYQKSKSPVRQSVETTTTKTVLSRYPGVTRAESPRQRAESPRHRPESPRQRTESPRQRPESDKPDKTPGYLRPTMTSQIKEETKVVEDIEVSSRRGSGKFGVELRRTSVERSTVSSERRRSVEHHQPCIEDIFDLDLLEQMLEKVVGYEQRRRIRAQIRIAKNQSEHTVKTNTYTKTSKHSTTTKTLSPDRKDSSLDRDSRSVPHKTASPERHRKTTSHKQIPDRTQTKESATNGFTKESARTATVTRQRLHSPEKPVTKTSLPRTPVRQPSPDKRRTGSPTKSAPKAKGNRFNEYASAYMKKIGLNEADKVKFTDAKVKKSTETKQTVKHEKQQETVQEFTTTKSFTERTSSQDVIEVVHTNGRSPSPEKRASPERKVQILDRKNQILERKQQSPERKTHSPGGKAHSPERKVHPQERRAYSPERKAQSPERLHQRTSSPDFKRPKADTVKETIIKTVYDIEKKIPSKPVQEEKPSWVTNRNLKKITSETRTFSSKKIENEKPKYRAPSPSKVISKPIDVITSSYGPGPLDADGKPLFGIKALRNGASNFQVKGTVIRREFHSRNGGEPEGSVSVTAYSSQPEELEQLLASQGEPPSRIHGLAAITTTKKFGGDTGNTLANVHTKEDRASLEQFTHHDRQVEHLERTYDSTQEFSEDSRTEVSGHRRIEPRVEQTEKINRTTKVTEVKRGKLEERREKMDSREDKKTVRQSSVKSLTEKYIKSANDSGKADRGSYPKAGLILRTTTMRDSVSSDDANPAGLVRTDSEHSLGSAEEVVTTTTTRSHRPGHTTHTRMTITTHEPAVVTKKTTVITQEPTVTRRVVTHDPVVHNITRSDGKIHQETITTERSFLDSNTKVTGVQDILTRMKNADIVIQEGDSTEDSEARALLNKFLGASVLMAGMQGYVQEQPTGKLLVSQEKVRSGGGAKVTSHSVEDFDLDQCWDERLLRKLLEECTEYEQRRRLRARLRSLMAEQEACASAVTEALGAAGAEVGETGDAREEEEVTVTSSVRRDSSDKTVSSSTTTKTTKVIEMTRPAPKPVSPFTKFRQLEKQNSTNSPNSPKTPQSPGSPSQPYFKFTDPALQCSALTIKERLLQWCRDKTRDYENVKLENFSTSWADGLAFCALIHHFLPNTFDYSKLTADKRRHNFTLAFKVADEKAGIYPLLDVDDMVAMRKPDWKCVFTYVQAIYRRFKDEQ